jgi:hypothetical protein
MLPWTPFSHLVFALSLRLVCRCQDDRPPYAISAWLRDSFGILVATGWARSHSASASQPARRRTTYRVRKGANKGKEGGLRIKGTSPQFSTSAFSRIWAWLAAQVVGFLFSFHPSRNPYSYRKEDVAWDLASNLVVAWSSCALPG